MSTRQPSTTFRAQVRARFEIRLFRFGIGPSRHHDLHIRMSPSMTQRISRRVDIRGPRTGTATSRSARRRSAGRSCCSQVVELDRISRDDVLREAVSIEWDYVDEH